MKNLICVIALSLSPVVAMAQGGANVIFQASDDYNIMVTPAEYTTSGSKILNFVADNKISLYNSELTLSREFGCGKTERYLYSISYTREVVNVKRTSLTLDNEPLLTYDSALSKDEMIAAYMEEQMRYGCQVTYYEDGSDVFFVGQTGMFETQMFYGERTPLAGVLLRDHSLYRFRARYEAEYSDWVESGRKELDMEYRAVPITSMGSDVSFVASQTLFDRDSEFEYVIPMYGNVGSADSGPVQINPYPEGLPVTSKTEYNQAYNNIVGYKIMSESGAEKHTIEFAPDCYISEYDFSYDFAGLRVLELADCRYLVTVCRKDGDSENRYYDFYRMTESSGIQKVNVEPIKMRVTPKMPKSGELLNVSLPNDGRNHDVIISSISGQCVSHRTVSGNETDVQIKAPVQPGMHVVTVTDGTSLVGSEKIIVK